MPIAVAWLGATGWTLWHVLSRRTSPRTMCGLTPDPATAITNEKPQTVCKVCAQKFMEPLI